MSTFRPALVALIAAAACPAAAAAAPDHNGAVNATTTTFNWDSKLGTGFTSLNTQHNGKAPCGTPVVHDCDDTLIHVTGCGTLQVTNTGNTPTAVDTDLYTYTSNAAGEKVGDEQYSGQSTPTPNEAVTVNVPAPDSYILVEIDYTDTIDPGGAVKGKATFEPAGDDVDPLTCIPYDTGEE